MAVFSFSAIESLEKSTRPSNIPIGGMTTSFTSEVIVTCTFPVMEKLA